MQDAEEVLLLVVDLLPSLSRLRLPHPLSNVPAQLEESAGVEVAAQKAHSAAVQELIYHSDLAEGLATIHWLLVLSRHGRHAHHCCFLIAGGFGLAFVPFGEEVGASEGLA
jgi:hypothetical protein